NLATMQVKLTRLSHAHPVEIPQKQAPSRASLRLGASTVVHAPAGSTWHTASGKWGTCFGASALSGTCPKWSNLPADGAIGHYGGNRTRSEFLISHFLTQSEMRNAADETDMDVEHYREMMRQLAIVRDRVRGVAYGESTGFYLYG